MTQLLSLSTPVLALPLSQFLSIMFSSYLGHVCTVFHVLHTVCKPSITAHFQLPIHCTAPAPRLLLSSPAVTKSISPPSAAVKLGFAYSATVPRPFQSFSFTSCRHPHSSVPHSVSLDDFRLILACSDLFSSSTMFPTLSTIFFSRLMHHPFD